MKLILRDYLSTLKEEGELDALISDFLFVKGILPISSPQKGVRQHGVDIAARGLENDVAKLFLITVKRGDISRKIWDNGPQSVRQSLNEILDVYIPHLPSALSKLSIKIVVATNGLLKQDVTGNWNGYVKKNEKADKFEFELWDIHRLTEELEQHFMHEGLMDGASKALFRKTLALVDLNEYDLRHYYQLIEQILFGEKVRSQKDAVKRLRLLNLCQNILFKWGTETDNLRNVYLSSERLTLRVGVFYGKSKYFEKKKFQQELFRLIQTRSLISYAYFKKIESHCYVAHAFSKYTNAIEVEYSLLVFEQMGVLALIGLEHVYIARLGHLMPELRTAYEDFALQCTEALWSMIEENPSSTFVLYDDFVVEINLVLLLLYATSNFEAGQVFILRLAKKMVQTFQFRKFFPCFHQNFDKLLDTILNVEESEITSSHLWLILAEWSLAFGSISNYEFIIDCLQKFFPNLNLQLWYPDENTEETYYEKNALHESGFVQVNIILSRDYREHLEAIQKNYHLINKEKDFYINNHLSFLQLIASRHFRNLPFPSLWRYFLQNSKD